MANPIGDRAARVAATRKGLSLLTVLVLFAAVLRLVDAIPGILVELPRTVREHPSVAFAERAIGRRVELPAYFPDSLRWPAARVRSSLGPARAVALAFSGADGRPARLALCDAIRSPEDCDDLLLASVTVLERRAIEFEGHQAQLRRVLERNGRLLHELRWQTGDRVRVMRYDGGVDQLLLMAQSTFRSGQ